MKAANKIKHTVATRNSQRKLAHFLKAKGLKATCERTKIDQGWVVNVSPVQRKKRLETLGNILVTYK